MRCKNKFENDRVCDMCKIVNNNEYIECLEATNKRVEMRSRLMEIRRKCSYKTVCWDEYIAFDGCNKNGKGYGRNAEECNVCLECENIIK